MASFTDRCLAFNGTDQIPGLWLDSTAHPEAASVVNINGFTTSMWVYIPHPDRFLNNAASSVAYSVSLFTIINRQVSPSDYFSIYITKNGSSVNLKVAFKPFGLNVAGFELFSETLPTEKWYHVVVVNGKNADDKATYLYINGVLADTAAWSVRRSLLIFLALFLL
jgi:hypothetical protein